MFGKSLGTAVAAELAAAGEVAGLVLESPFCDLPSVGQTHYRFLPVSLLIKEKYNTLLRIQEINCPLLVIVETKDCIVPPEQSRNVFGRAKAPKNMFELKDAGHTDIQAVGGQSYWNTLREWLAGL